MTKVEKLKILGIRSFGDEDGDEQNIKFFSPLTLILGQNGCGKTTIIECLKYALSGDYPPGRGNSFVHDPKVANTREVLGQIKLHFYDTKGKSVIVTRSMKCTQMATGTKCTTLDQIIARPGENGGAPFMDTRCADINEEVSRCLGVSKAVMTYVLFCPQEASNWPLEEGGKVKEKFDAIFESTKYNKCIEHIRKLVKEKTEDLRVLENDVSHLRNYKMEAEEKKSNHTNVQQRVATSRDEIKELQNRLKPISEKLDGILSVETKVIKQNTTLVTKRTQLEGVRKQLNELHGKIKTPYPGSTEELRQAIDSFKRELKDKERSCSKLQEELKEVEREEERANDQVGEEQVKLGRLQGEEKQHKRLMNDRSRRLKSIAAELSLSVGSLPSGELKDYEVRNLLEEVESEMKNLENKLERCESTCKAEEKRLQNQVGEARDLKVKIEQEIKMKEKQLSDTKSEVLKLKADLAEVQSSAGRLTKLEEKLKRADDKLRNEESAFNLEAEKSDINSLRKERDSLQMKLKEVNNEMHSLQEQSDLQVKLDVHLQTQSSKDAEIKRLQRKHSETLAALLQNVPERDFKNAIESHLQKLGKTIADMNNEMRGREKELMELNANRKHLKDQLREKEDQLRENEEKLYELCDVDGYEERVASLRRQVEELQDTKGELTSFKHLFGRYIKKLDEPKPCCPLCHRDFSSDAEAQGLSSDLKRKERELPVKLNENKVKLESREAQYSRLLELKPVHKSISEMRDIEIPDLRRKVSVLENQIKDVKAEIEVLQTNLRQPKEDEDLAKSTMNDMVLLDQMIGQLRQVNEEIKHIRASFPPGESKRTVKAVQAEQQIIQAKLQDCLEKSERKQTNINSHSEEISKLREERNHIMSEKLKIESSLQSSNSLRDKLKEKEELKEVVEVEISMNRSDLCDADSSLKKIQSEKDKTIANLQSEVEESKEKVYQVQRNVKEIQSLNRSIEKMESDGVERNVAASHARLDSLRNDAKAASDKRQELFQKIDEIRMELSTQQVRERELKDNLLQIELQNQERSLDIEVSNLRLELGDVKFETMREEKRKLVAAENDINRKISVVEGRKLELETNILQLEKDLANTRYKNAESDYCDKYFEFLVTKKALQDLKKFNVALDWAVMHFHKERMQSINAIIRELWTAVYKGNDVEYIEIRTDDGGDGTTITDSRRSYKYRVVMVKNDVELDMRDRCSAGQKMLACLIIRMALAETFSARCGVFTLDEPTANLDYDNSISLSDALAEIVRRRHSQKNFQLIVITHDERFVEAMVKEGNVPAYYTVSRNSQAKSVIRKHNVE